MITKEMAFKIAKNYLILKEREFTKIGTLESIKFKSKEEILYGNFEGKVVDLFVVDYGEIWGNEVRSAFINISAETGEVLYTLNCHGVIEELES